jgi:hypothetical protein
MKSIVVALLFLLQTPPLPPAYPRPGATKIFENDRVVVWNIAWLKQQYPLHRHIYDLVGVYYEPGDRMIVAQDGTRRPVSTKAGDIAFQKSGVTHIEEGASDPPLRAVFIEFKQPTPSGQTDTGAQPAAFPRDGEKQLLDNERTTVWERPADSKSAGSHRHIRDTVAVWIDGNAAHASFVPRGTAHADDGAGPARSWIFELK